MVTTPLITVHVVYVLWAAYWMSVSFLEPSSMSIAPIPQVFLLFRVMFQADHFRG